MSNSRYTLNTFTLSELKSQIAVKLRFPIIGKPDCLKLSEILVKEGHGSISVTTLYRLFVNFNGIIPYLNTLDTLAKFIGYPCWSDFVENIEINTPKYSISPKIDVSSSLLYHCIETESNKPLLPFFESIEDSEYKFKVKIALEIYDSLLKATKPEVFFSNFHSNKFVKQFVLEDAFDPAFRIKNYEYAYKFYGKDSNFDSSLVSIQDYIFSQSVLFRYYFLIGKLDEAYAIGLQMYGQFKINLSDLDAIYIFPSIRFRTYKIWYYKLIKASKNEIENYVLELIEYCKEQYKLLGSNERRIVFHTLAEVFCNATIDAKYHLILKTIFKEEFSTLPNYLFEKPLEKSLPYFEANGLMHHRPIKQS